MTVALVEVVAAIVVVAAVAADVARADPVDVAAIVAEALANVARQPW